MRFTQFILIEGRISKLQSLANELVDQFAEEEYYDHDAIIRAARDRLSNEPYYAQSPKRLEAALEIISEYIS